jgi:hypothetical protein
VGWSRSSNSNSNRVTPGQEEGVWKEIRNKPTEWRKQAKERKVKIEDGRSKGMKNTMSRSRDNSSTRRWRSKNKRNPKNKNKKNPRLAYLRNSSY